MKSIMEYYENLHIYIFKIINENWWHTMNTTRRINRYLEQEFIIVTLANLRLSQAQPGQPTPFFNTGSPRVKLEPRLWIRALASNRPTILWLGQFITSSQLKIKMI